MCMHVILCANMCVSLWTYVCTHICVLLHYAYVHMLMCTSVCKYMINAYFCSIEFSDGCVD